MPVKEADGKLKRSNDMNAGNLLTAAGQVGVGESCGGKYASCKCDPALKTCSSKEVGQGASCGGKYQSCACKSEYAYNTSNCTSPRSPTGDSCGGKYTTGLDLAHLHTGFGDLINGLLGKSLVHTMIVVKR